MRKNFFTLLIISMLTSSILIGCNSEKVETPTNEMEVIENTTTPTQSPTPTEYIDYNNPLEVGGVSGMGVSNIEITPENEQFLNHYSGIMDYKYEPQNGVTYNGKAYVYSSNEFKSFMETNVEFSNGNNYSFSWIGETSLGTHSKVDTNGTSIVLYNEDYTAMLAAWNGSALEDNQFETYKNGNVKNEISVSDSTSNVNECWEQIITDDKLAYVYATNFTKNDVEYTGYKKIILDKTRDKFVQFYYVQPIENFNKEQAYETILSIELKDKEDVLLNKIETITDKTIPETNIEQEVETNKKQDNEVLIEENNEVIVESQNNTNVEITN